VYGDGRLIDEEIDEAIYGGVELQACDQTHGVGILAFVNGNEKKLCFVFFIVS
jgi:hypothetical protein